MSYFPALWNGIAQSSLSFSGIPCLCTLLLFFSKCPLPPSAARCRDLFPLFHTIHGPFIVYGHAFQPLLIGFDWQQLESVAPTACVSCDMWHTMGWYWRKLLINDIRGGEDRDHQSRGQWSMIGLWMVWNRGKKSLQQATDGDPMVMMKNCS